MVYGVQSPYTGELLYPPPGSCWRLGKERMMEALRSWAPYRLQDIGDIEKRATICGLPSRDLKPTESIVLDVSVPEAQALVAERTGPWPEVYFINQGSLLQVKGYKPEGVVPRTIWTFREVGSNRNSKAESKALFDGTSFATPKPERLIERVLSTLR